MNIHYLSELVIVFHCIISNASKIKTNNAESLKYIQQNLHSILFHFEENQIQIIRNLFYRSSQAYKLCKADVDNKNDIINTKFYSPCGIIHIITIHFKFKEHWLIVVAPKFSILVHFKRLVMDFADQYCDRGSSLALSEYIYGYMQTARNLIMCGSILAFDHMFQSNICKITMFQVNVLVPYKLTMEYEVIDKLTNRGTYIRNVAISTMGHSIHNVKNNPDINIWKILTSHDRIIYINEIFNNHTLGHLYIFEGPAILEKQKHSFELNITSRHILVKDLMLNYFVSFIEFYLINIVNVDVSVVFNTSAIDIDHINGSGILSIKHNGHITHKHLNVYSPPGYYIALSINIRKFNGIANHLCNFGGIVLYDRQLNSIFPQQYGPYCIPGRDGQPLVTNSGTDKIVLPFAGMYHS